MQREVKNHLFDINESISPIQEYLGDNYSFNKYQNNKLLRRGVERELGIIGEALSKLLKIDNEIQITNPRRIIDLRNWVIHGYYKVDDVIIWGIVTKDIPILKTKIENLINT